VQSSMLHGSETWPVTKENEVAIQWAEMRMVRWMCGIKLQDRVPSKGLRERLGLDLGTAANSKFSKVAMVRACAAITKTMIGLRNVWSMKLRVPGQEVDQRKLGDCGKRLSGTKLNREDTMDHNR